MMNCKVEELEAKIKCLQQEIELCKNDPAYQISKYVQEFSEVKNCHTTYSGAIELEASFFSGDVTLPKIYKELGYHCTQAWRRNNDEWTFLQFKKN